MKPAWDQLMQDYDGAEGALVADVDCEGEGKDLCEQHNVEGFPTIKWGDPSAMEDYEGEREYEDMNKFAEENLKPSCSPANIDLCDEDKKAQIQKFQAMDEAVLLAEIEKVESEIKQASTDFDAEVEKLQAKYEEFEKEKEKKMKELKSNADLPMMKAVIKATEAKESKTTVESHSAEL